jgi:hypothetical protein
MKDTATKLNVLRNHEDSYVRLVYRFHDGTEIEVFGYVYVSKNTGTVSLSGEWIDLDILAVIEVRDLKPVVVYSYYVEPINSKNAGEVS